MSYTCKGCEERHVGCHATCEKYLAAKAERDAMNESLRKENQTYWDVMFTLLRKKPRKRKR
jgi:hypothetical protein